MKTKLKISKLRGKPLITFIGNRWIMYPVYIPATIIGLNKGWHKMMRELNILNAEEQKKWENMQ